MAPKELSLREYESYSEQRKIKTSSTFDSV